MSHVDRSGNVTTDGKYIGRVRKQASKWTALHVDTGPLDGAWRRQCDATLALIAHHRAHLEAARAAVEEEPATNGATPTSKRRGIQSGWCMSGFHGRCCHQLQVGTDRRPEILCACRCHKLVRNMAWAKAR